MKAKTRTENILIVMQILAWVAFVGYAIEAGAILVSFIVSFINPEVAKHLYNKVNLNDLRQLNIWYYSCTMAFMVILPVMKSFVWLLVIKTLQKINLVTPFTMEVVNILERISYVLFGVWIVGALGNAYSNWLSKRVGEFEGTHITGEFIFMAGLIFVISQIFKRGVEIQSENDLTV